MNYSAFQAPEEFTCDLTGKELTLDQTKLLTCCSSIIDRSLYDESQDHCPLCKREQMTEYVELRDINGTRYLISANIQSSVRDFLDTVARKCPHVVTENLHASGVLLISCPISSLSHFDLSKGVKETEGIYLVQLSRLREEYKNLFWDPTAVSLEPRNVENGVVICPVTLDEIPVDDSIVMTCCFNAISYEAWIALRYGRCPMCRQEMLTDYIHFLSRHGEKQIVGTYPEWTIQQLIEKIYSIEPELIVENLRAGERLFKIHIYPDQSLSYFRLTSGKLLREL